MRFVPDIAIGAVAIEVEDITGFIHSEILFGLAAHAHRFKLLQRVPVQSALNSKFGNYFNLLMVKN